MDLLPRRTTKVATLEFREESRGLPRLASLSLHTYGLQ
jgi:hypothetical protein